MIYTSWNSSKNRQSRGDYWNTEAAKALDKMACYFFHIAGPRPHLDETGEELLHDHAAWETAMRVMRDLEYGYGPGEEWRLEVHHDDTPVFLITVTSARLR